MNRAATSKRHCSILLAMNGGRRNDLAAFALIGILTFIAYSNAFHGDFQYDDERLIRFNFALRDWSNWKNIARFEAFRPLTLMTYALNFRISQKDPFSYHVFDFVLHLLSTGLFFVFIRRISQNRLLCFFSAALFAVHPLNTESVVYTASRPILLCALFYISALLCFDLHLRKPNLLKIIAFCFFFLLGVLSKEEAALIPFAALLYNYAFYGIGSVKKHRLFHFVTLIVVGCGLLLRISFVYRFGLPHPVSVYVPTELFVWLRYLALAVFPIPLNVDHFVERLHPAHWKFLLALAAVSLSIVFLWRIRKGQPWTFFWGIWFYLNLSATSFVPLNDFMAEHRTYISMFGFAACIASLIKIRQVKSRLIPAALSCLIIFYMAATWKRNLVWQDRVTLWVDAVQKSPQKFRPHVNLAFVLYQLRIYEAALQEYTVARSIDPHIPLVHSGRGFTLLELGRMEEAEKSFETALNMDPNYIDSKTGLGIIRYRRQQYEQALAYFVQTYPHRRESPEIAAMMCDSYLKLGKDDEAKRILNEASRWDPRFSEVSRLLQTGDIDRSGIQLQRIIQQS
jgi:protein O-mannosyl-transferase